MKLWRTVSLLTGLLGCSLPAYAIETAKPTAPSHAIDPARLQKAQRIIQLIIPAEQRQAMFAKMLDAYMANFMAGAMDAIPGGRETLQREPELRHVMLRFVSRQRDLALQDLDETAPELMLAYANAYARAFDADELDAIGAFFATPAGKKYLQQAPGLLADPDIAAWQRGIAARAQTRKDEELKKLRDEMMPIIHAKGAERHGS